MTEKISNPYKIIDDATVTKYIDIGTDRIHSFRRWKGETHDKPLEKVEEQMLQDTDGLIGIFDGSIDSGKQFIVENSRRYESEVRHVIYLDKSARPVRALVDELWHDLSEKQKPTSSFLNIDKIDYMLMMGYSVKDIEDLYIDPKGLTLDKIDQRFLKIHVARIRSLYLDVSEKQLLEVEKLIESVEHDEAMSLDSLDVIWEIPTKLDGQHVAIVDEVKSSGATLSIADRLLQMAMPEVKFEPCFWSTPTTLLYNMFDATKDEVVDKLADTEKPLWYNSKSSGGRGGIENKNEELSAKSRNTKMRVGGSVLSSSSKLLTGRLDVPGIALREDFKIFADRARSGDIKFRPSLDRDNYDAQEVIFSKKDD